MLPRQILPGTTYFIVRRCVFRQFLLTPSEEVNQIFKYCLAYAAQQTGIQIHAYVVMSNHWHGVLTDPYGRLPEFTEILHRLVAKCINTLVGRSENVWSMDRYSAIPLFSLADVIDKISYVMANPVAAFLVRTPEQWPGLVTTIPQLAEHIEVVDRPEIFFRPNGKMPAQVTLETTPPPQSRTIDIWQYKEMVRQALEGRILQAQRALAARKGSVLGRWKIMKQSRTATPCTPEPVRTMRPRFSSRSIRQRNEAISAYKRFVNAYRTAWEKFRRGIQNVLFPPGTYWLRKHMNVACASPG